MAAKKKSGRARGYPKVQGGGGNRVLAHAQHPFAEGVFHKLNTTKKSKGMKK